LFGWFRFISRRSRVRRGRFRLNVDDYFPSGLKRLRLQRHEEKRRRVQRDDDRDSKRAKPGRTNGRRLEEAPVQSCEGHGACALGAAGKGAPGAAGVGIFGAAGVCATIRRGPDTIAMREMPFAASSSITDTTSP
jgi:hypothetical protein